MWVTSSATGVKFYGPYVMMNTFQDTQGPNTGNLVAVPVTLTVYLQFRGQR